MRQWPKNTTVSLGVLFLGALGMTSGALALTQADQEMAAVLSMIQLSDIESNLLTIKKEIAANPNSGDPWARLGETYLQLKDFAQAETAFHEARARRLSPRRWAVPLAKVYLARKKYVALLDELPEPKDWLPEDEWVEEVLLLRAEAFRQLEMFQRSAQLYNNIISADSENARAHFGLAKVKFAMGKSEASILESLEKAKAANYNNIDDMAQLVALMARRSGQWTVLEKAYQDKADGDKADPLSLMTMTYATLFQGHAGEFFHYADKLYKALPNHPKAQYLYALSRYQIDNRDQAEEILANAIDSDPSNVLPYFLLAKIYYENQNLPLAASILSKLHRFSPDNTNGTFFLSVVLLQLKEAERALPLIQQQIEKRPSDYRLYGLMGNTMLQRADWPAALDYYSMASSYFTDATASPLVVDFSEDEDALAAYLDLNNAVRIDDSLLRMDAIRTLSALQNYDYIQAEGFAAKNLMIQQDPVANYLYGLVLTKMDQHQKAESYLEMANVDAPTFKANKKLLAGVYLQNGQVDLAQELVSQMLESDPKNSALHVLQASIADKRDEASQTIAWLCSAIENDPENPEPRLALVSYYLKIEDDAKALALAKSSFERFPKEIQFLNTLAKVALKSEQWDVAVDAHLKLEKRLPGSGMVLLNLARAYHGASNKPKALEAVDRILSQDSHDLGALVFKAQLLEDENDLIGVKQVADKILSIKPEHPLGLTLLGKASEMEGQWHNAVRFYDKAYDAAPSAQLAKARYDARKEIEQLAEGFAVLQQWIKANPDDMSTKRYLAEQYDTLGYSYEAILAYERLLLDEPDDIPSLISLARLYGKYDTQRALDFAKRAQHINPDSMQVQATLGWIMVMDGNPKKGFQFLSKAAESNPEDVLTRYHLAVAKHRLGDLNGSKEDLTYVIRQNVLPSVQSDAADLLRSLDFEEHYDAGIRL